MAHRRGGPAAGGVSAEPQASGLGDVVGCPPAKSAEARVRRPRWGGAGVSRRRSLCSSFCPVLAEPRQLPTAATHVAFSGRASVTPGSVRVSSEERPPSSFLLYIPQSARGMRTSEEGAGSGQHQRRLGSPWSGDSLLFYHLTLRSIFHRHQSQLLTWAHFGKIQAKRDMCLLLKQQTEASFIS